MKTNLLFIILVLTTVISCQEEALPLLNIKSENGIEWVEKKPCTLIYSDSKKTEELKGRIKYRGGISRKYAKHSYSLELKEKYKFSTLPKDDDWILNASYIDKTLMRHKISYDIFREMSPQNIASKSSFVHLKINNTYVGLYLLMEKINASMIGLNKWDTTALLFKAPNIFHESHLTYVKDTSNYYQQKYPNKKLSDKTYCMEQLRQFFFYSSDDEFADKISSWMDIKSVIDWHLILLFSNNQDGIMKNFYLYKIDKNTPFRFAIWDYDHSYGRDSDNERNLMERELDCNRSILLKRLLTIPKIKYLEQLKHRWLELRKQNIFSVENFEKHITANDKIIKKEITKNFKKWPIDAQAYYDDNNYEQELDLMRTFIKMRIEQLDLYFQKIPENKSN